MTSKKHDAKSVKQTKVRNFVAESEILTQAINLENKYLRINSEFACIPSRIKTIPNPPLVNRPNKMNSTNPTKENTDKNEEFNQYMENQLVKFYETPSQKYKYPMTSNQVFGWHQNCVV